MAVAADTPDPPLWRDRRASDEVLREVRGRLEPWPEMFDVTVARQAKKALGAAGARVTYREIDDLSHCYPREMNIPILDWLAAT